MSKPTATVMTPSLPTRSIARAMSWPISVSPLAEIVPTCGNDAPDHSLFHVAFCQL